MTTKRKIVEADDPRIAKALEKTMTKEEKIKVTRMDILANLEQARNTIQQQETRIEELKEDLKFLDEHELEGT